MGYIYFGIVTTGIFLISAIACGANVLFQIAFLIWMYMMIYSYKKIEYRSILFAFGIAFFVFLLGRDLIEQFDLMEKDWFFEEKTNNHYYFCLILSLVGVWVAFSGFSKRKPRSVRLYKKQQKYYLKARNTAKKLFFVVLPFALIYWLAIAYFVYRTGYHSYYSDFTEVLNANPIFNALNKITVMLNVTFCCYLATLPTKEEFKRLLIPYVLFLVITAFSGQRGPFILGLLLIFIFIVYMQGVAPSENWFKRKYLNYAIIAVPFVASLGSLYNAWRLEKDTDEIGFADSFCNFFYEQGVTSYIVKRAYDHENKIPKDIYVLQFTHTGILARILGIQVYYGNTIEHATKGGSFAHALGYVVLGNAYLAGTGTGSSFIAELYYDFGYPGVFIGSLIYGFIFSLMYRTDSLLKRGTIFVCITQMLWACRSSYTGMLTLLFTPSVMLVCLLVFLLNRKKITFNNRLSND